MTEITLVKGETSALDRTWMSMPDGSTQQVAVHAIHDLPHLVVESLFGIEDGLWGVLALGGFAAANRARTRSRGRRPRLVTDVPLGDLGARNWRGHIVAKAATNAVMNRWQDGPDTPDGVRARLSPDAAADEDCRQRIDRIAPDRADATDGPPGRTERLRRTGLRQCPMSRCRNSRGLIFRRLRIYQEAPVQGVDARVVGAGVEDQIPQSQVYLSRSRLVDDAIEEPNVAADAVIEAECCHPEVGVGELISKATAFEFRADVTGDHGDEVVKRHSIRQAACGLLDVEEVFADVVVAI